MSIFRSGEYGTHCKRGGVGIYGAGCKFRECTYPKCLPLFYRILLFFRDL